MRNPDLWPGLSDSTVHELELLEVWMAKLGTEHAQHILSNAVVTIVIANSRLLATQSEPVSAPCEDTVQVAGGPSNGLGAPSATTHG